MSRKSSAVAGGDKGTVDQYNFVRDEAKMSAFLLASATSTLKLYVHDGTVYFRGTKVDFTGGLTPVMAAPTASSRIDIVSMASSSEIVITSGVEADSPTAPTAPEDDMVICEVYNRAGQVEITETDEAGSNGYINKDLRPALLLEKHASTTDKGIVEEATKAELNAGTDLGGSGAKLVAGSSILATSIYYVQLPSSDQKDALAGTGTPNSTNKYVTNDDTTATPTADKVARFNADGEIDGVDKIKDPMTYGETINGDTLPVPIYQDTSDNEVYKCDANDTDKLEFLGFAIENGTDGVEKYVQLVGIVKDFSGLDEGELYYVQDAVGTIGKTPGEHKILVGRAISTTELFIIKKDAPWDNWLEQSVVFDGSSLTSDTRYYDFCFSDDKKYLYCAITTVNSAIYVQRFIRDGLTGKYYWKDIITVDTGANINGGGITFHNNYVYVLYAAGSGGAQTIQRYSPDMTGGSVQTISGGSSNEIYGLTNNGTDFYTISNTANTGAKYTLSGTTFTKDYTFSITDLASGGGYTRCLSNDGTKLIFIYSGNIIDSFSWSALDNFYITSVVFTGGTRALYTTIDRMNSAGYCYILGLIPYGNNASERFVEIRMLPVVNGASDSYLKPWYRISLSIINKSVL